MILILLRITLKAPQVVNYKLSGSEIVLGDYVESSHFLRGQWG